MFEVLLIDDEPWVLMGLQRIFHWEKHGFHVAAAFSSSLDALAFLQQNHVDVILSDIRMPDLSGLELLQKAKELNPSITFILVSGFADFSYAQTALKSGAYDYLLKPIDHTKIEPFLQRLLDHLEGQRLQKNLTSYEELRTGQLPLSALLPSANYSYYQVYSVTSSKDCSDFVPLLDCSCYPLALSCRNTVYICGTNQDLAPGLILTSTPDLNIGISELAPASSTKNLVLQAESAAMLSFFEGKSSVFRYRPTDPALIKAISKNIVDYCKAETLSALSDYFYTLPTENLTVEDVVFLWNQLQIQLSNVSTPSGIFRYSTADQLTADFRDWPSFC